MPDAAPATAVALVEPDLPVTLEDAILRRDATARALRRAARKARAPQGIISGGAGFQGRRGYRAFRLAVIASFFAFVVAPIVVMSVYWGLIASKQYSTEMKFALRAGEASPLDSLGGMFGLGTSQQAQDTQILAEYVTSRAMIDALGATLDLRTIYGHGGGDYFSRFDPDDSVEDLEKYWKKRVDAKIEKLSGIVSVSVRAFSPDESLALGKTIFTLSEKLVNDLSTRSRRDALTQARSELDRAEKRLQLRETAMRDARNAEGVLDANTAAEALTKVVTQLRLELARTEQDLASQGSAQDSPQSRVIQLRAASIKAQIEDYTRQIADTNSGSGSNSMADRLRALSTMQIELNLARQQYAQAFAIYESARTDLETQHAYLVTVLPPTLAQKSTYPRRMWEWSIIIVPTIIGWLAAVAIAFVVRDNMAK